MARLIIYALLVVLLMTLVGGLLNGQPEVYSTANQATTTLNTTQVAAFQASTNNTPQSGQSQPQSDALSQLLGGGANFLGGLHGLIKGLFEMVLSSPINLHPFWGAVELLVIVLIICGFLHLAWEKAIIRKGNRPY